MLDDGCLEQFLRDGPVVALVRLRRLEVARLPLHDDRLHPQRSHFRARAAARVAGLRPRHDRRGQHLVLTGARDVHHREIAGPRAAEVLRDPVTQIDVVEPEVGHSVEELELSARDAQHRPPG